MTSMDESWRSWFCDLEAAAGDCSFTLGAHELAGGEIKLEEEKSESILRTDHNIINNSDCSYSTFNFNTQDSINISNSTCTVDHASDPLIHAQAGLHSAFILKDEAPLPSKQSQRRNYNKARDRQVEDKHHIIAERKRREKISQYFIALSALIPGLKKVDKATVLEEAIRYVKELKERVEVLEEKSKKKRVESVVFVKKSELSAHQLYVSQDPIKWNNEGVAEAEVEARVSEKEVLIRIQCEKQKGGMRKIVREIEKLHLSVMNSSVMQFGSSILDITIIAEIKADEFRLSAKELARKLRVALLQLMERPDLQ